MKKIAIVGLGWLGMPLATAMLNRGWRVMGSKTTPDGVEAARLCGIDAYPLRLTPEMHCQADHLERLLDADALVVTLPASRTVAGDGHYIQAVQNLVDSALASRVKRILFTSSTSVYGNNSGTMNESATLRAHSASGQTLVALESWLHDLPGTSVDIVRLAGLVGPGRHPGRFLAGRRDIAHGGHGVNLLHLDDAVAAIILLLQSAGGGRIYNLCAPQHPARHCYYPLVSRQLGLAEPHFLPADESDTGKLIDGSKICADLGFRYQWPDPLRMPVS